MILLGLKIWLLSGQKENGVIRQRRRKFSIERKRRGLV